MHFQFLRDRTPERGCITMSMDLNQLSQQVPLRVASPQLVAANHILALSSAELQALIHREVDENPAMEVEELPICQQCGRPLQNGFCAACTASQRTDTNDTRDHDDFGDDGVWQRRATSGGEGAEVGPTTRVAAQMSLAQHLTLSLQPQCLYRQSPPIYSLTANL